MGKIHDLTNKTFGKLLVLQRVENDKQGLAYLLGGDDWR